MVRLSRQLSTLALVVVATNLVLLSDYVEEVEAGHHHLHHLFRSRRFKLKVKKAAILYFLIKKKKFPLLLPIRVRGRRVPLPFPLPIDIERPPKIKYSKKKKKVETWPEEELTKPPPEPWKVESYKEEEMEDWDPE